jgi:hypothetical protein
MNPRLIRPHIAIRPKEGEVETFEHRLWAGWQNLSLRRDANHIRAAVQVRPWSFRPRL